MRFAVVACALLVGVTAAPAAAQAPWGLNEARQLVSGAGGDAIGSMALRIAIHPHTPQTTTVTASVNPDGGDLVFNFAVQWTTSVMANGCQTILVARISRGGFQSASVQTDNSGKTSAEPIGRMQGFMRDVLWPAVNGRVVNVTDGSWGRRNFAGVTREIPQELPTSLFNAGAFGGSSYMTARYVGLSNNGEMVCVLVILWEKGTFKTNQQTILRWRFGQGGHVGLETESTSAPTNADGMTSYLRDTVLPFLRGRLRF